jgi:hypothetical protein
MSQETNQVRGRRPSTPWEPLGDQPASKFGTIGKKSKNPFKFFSKYYKYPMFELNQGHWVQTQKKKNWTFFFGINMATTKRRHSKG